MNARIGSLHVALGLDSAQFEQGLKKARSGLAGFASFAKAGLATVAVAATAAGAALSVAVKGAIDHADELSKTAQSVGVTTEALSRLEWAAQLSDVSLQELSAGLQRLTRNLSEVAQGRSPQAATAFRALGISVTDAAGNLRSSDAVLADVAEQFARLEDGSEKTALAIALFGRAGANLIPLLNSGRTGLAEMAAEADRLGITIGTNTGKAAEQFNDSLTRLQAVFDGIVNKVMAAVLPALNRLGDTLASPEFAASAQQIATAVVDAMKIVADAVMAAVGAFNALREAMAWANTHDMFGNPITVDVGTSGNRSQEYKKGLWGIGGPGALASLREQLNAGNMSAPGNDFFAGIFETTNSTADAFGRLSDEIEGIGTSSTAASGGISKVKTELEKTKPAMEQFSRAGEQMTSTLASGFTDIFKGVLTGANNAADAVSGLLDQLATMALNSAFQGLLSGLFGGLRLPGFANGTNFAPGGLAVVGERGPEIVNLPRGSKVIPNHQVRGGGAGASVLEVALSPELVAQVLKEAEGQSVRLVEANNKARDNLFKNGGNPH
jgi:phage-related tail protein